jgi:plasmid replication initiation protein
MEFKIIAELLKKFKNIAVAQELVKNETAEIINKKTGITINTQQVSLLGNKIFLKGSPAIKSLVFMRKNEILNELKNKLGKQAPIDIR